MADQRMTEEEMNRVIDRFDTDREFIISEAFSDGGTDSPFPRLHRAALNQLCQGDATVSRYGIWANTVRDSIRQAEQEMTKGNLREARRLMRQAANSLSAFSELQARFDTMGIGRVDQDTEG
jgi:hypothetical protein